MQAKIIIGIAAIVGLVVAFVFKGESAQGIALKTFSIASSVTAIGLLVYDRWVWRYAVVRFFSSKPDFNGTWRGALRSDYLKDGLPIPPIPAALRIKQTNSTISVTLFTAESSSETTLSELTRLPDDRWRLRFAYTNTPRPSVRSRSDQHQGLCELYVSGEGNTLSGSYFTSRRTTGELHFDEWSKTLFAGANAAAAAENFGTPSPFVNSGQ